jgi:hypothetical protein
MMKKGRSYAPQARPVRMHPRAKAQATTVDLIDFFIRRRDRSKKRKTDLRKVGLYDEIVNDKRTHDTCQAKSRFRFFSFFR